MDKDSLFKEVLRENKDRIYRICCGYERDPDSRDDLYQEILLNIWKSLEKFEGRSMISTWIYRIAVNTALMHVKKESKLNSMKTSIDENSIDIAEAGPEEKEQKIELGRQIEKLYSCINMLGKLERLIISMVLEDLSYKDIAEVTGLSPTNVGVKINRIKKELARLMEGAKEWKLMN
jgi:RNA polymerase sigma-70 factor (ECF subfamily)